jgi:very-short-patch-repair endonuclease
LGYALQKKLDQKELQPFAFKEMALWSESDYRAARMDVEKLDRHIGETGNPKKNPFKTSCLVEFLPSQRSNIENALNKGKNATQALHLSATNLAIDMGLLKPENRSEIDIICRAARRTMEAPHLEGLALSSGAWQERRDDLAALIIAGRMLSQAHAKFDELLIDDAWQQDILGVRHQYSNWGHKWWRFFSSDFRRAKARLQGLCRKPLPTKANEAIEVIDAILDSQKHQKTFNQLSELGALLYGAQWKKRDSDWEVLEKITEWVVGLYRDLGDGRLPEGIVNFLSGSPKLDSLKSKVILVEEQLNQHESNIVNVVELLRLKIKKENITHWNLTLEKQGQYLTYWLHHLDKLFHLVRFNQLADELNGKNLKFVVDVAKDWSYNQGVLTRLFDFSWYNGLVEKAYIETLNIKRFDRTHHSHVLHEFNRLDHLLFRHNQTRLAAKHWHSLPNMNGSGELSIINREINKKRRQMPIRKLIYEAGRAIQTIKPIFMMSPMSIATYIPPGSINFDLVVFDEASQVKPVDAFGAIIRAKQSVVVGDSKQLPPTSFFDSLAESDIEEDFENVADMESILSLFLGKGAPERMLRWHYRSRHDSLIAVSNYEFYDNKLVIFPSPGSNLAARGLKLQHLPDTGYDRGKTRTNQQEAKSVARFVIEHAKTLPDLTLGVVAFSTAQRDAIEMQLELLRRADPSCEQFFNEHEREPFFVKNIENVQGDERDVIFISIGYGKTTDGYMTMNFGPLNRDGGERRLNVLITRARLAMDVFANFTADDIDLNRTTARGVVALKNFLAFAQTGILEQPYSTGKEPDSPFEEAVIIALKQAGVDVEPQIGTAGFFIDIAVKDQEFPGRYVLGIECDGASYHSSRSARDRDRLRQEVLEGLGWRLHRIWSTEWYRNPQVEIERTLSAIEKAKSDSRKKITAIALDLGNAKQTSTIVRDESIHPDEKTLKCSSPYIKAVLHIPLGTTQLHQLSITQLLPYIIRVVEVESPIHKSELLRRITEGAGLKRSGSRIQTTVQSALNQGTKERKIILKGDFIWSSAMETPQIRDRSGLNGQEKKFEFVPPEEITLAIKQVVTNGFSLNFDDSLIEAAHLLGYSRLPEQSKNHFKSQLNKLVEEKVLTLRNGVLFLT